MSDRVTQSYSDYNGGNGMSMHSVQSVWMSRWTRTSYNATAQTHNTCSGNNEDFKPPRRSIVELETVSKLSKSIKRLRESETQTFQVTSSRTIAKESLGTITRLVDNPNCLASHILPYQEHGQYEGEKMWRSLISRSSLAGKDEVPRLKMLEPKKHSISLVCGVKNDNVEPSTSNKHLPEDFQQLPSCSFTRLFRNESKELHPPPRDQQKLQHPLHDGETMRMRDSVMGIPQKSLSMFITKGTDANLGERNKRVIGGSRLWSEFDGESLSSDRDRPSKSYKGGIKIQLLDCSTGSEGKDSKGSQVVKNESSAETDAMDIVVFPEKNQLCGVNKVNEIEQVSPLGLGVECSRKAAGFKKLDLDINLELPAPTDNVEPTSSRTESLDLEVILGNASSSRADICPEEQLGQEPCSRWVKRLKLGACASLAFGAPHAKAHKFITIACSKPTSSNRPSTGIYKKDMELLTSHSWIQRLLTTSHQPGFVCEPESSKLEDDDFQKKQLPSLGAMALMGRAMNGFQPCEFRKTGPLVVWNTREFLKLHAK